MNTETMLIIDGTTGQIERLPQRKVRYRAKLDSLADIRREMSKVYRESRTGTIDSTQAAKSVWMLTEIKKVIESEAKFIETPIDEPPEPTFSAAFIKTLSDEELEMLMGLNDRAINFACQ